MLLFAQRPPSTLIVKQIFVKKNTDPDFYTGSNIPVETCDVCTDLGITYSRSRRTASVPKLTTYSILFVLESTLTNFGR